MATDLQTTANTPESPADGLSRLMELAASADWTTAHAKQLAGDNPQAVESLISRYETSVLPLADVEPDFAGKRSKDLRDWLRPIGIKLAPTMSPDQATAWLQAMVLALSDLPADIAIKAAKEALRVPMNFMNEVDAAIRDKASVMITRRANAIDRLRRLKAEIERPIAQPRLVDAEPDRDTRPLTMQEIAALPIALRKIGLTLGEITQEQFDAAPEEPALWATTNHRREG